MAIKIQIYRGQAILRGDIRDLCWTRDSEGAETFSANVSEGEIQKAALVLDGEKQARENENEEGRNEWRQKFSI